jgi:hypothetical protein
MANSIAATEQHGLVRRPQATAVARQSRDLFQNFDVGCVDCLERIGQQVARVTFAAGGIALHEVDLVEYGLSIGLQNPLPDWIGLTASNRASSING